VIALSECRSFSSRLLEWDRKEEATLVSEFGVWRLFQCTGPGVQLVLSKLFGMGMTCIC
jgi:hypothetical protein